LASPLPSVHSPEVPPASKVGEGQHPCRVWPCPVVPPLACGSWLPRWPGVMAKAARLDDGAADAVALVLPVCPGGSC